MNRHLFAAREMLKAAKAILSEYEYIYDPEHRNRPEGGGWEKTQGGWSRGKEERIDENESPRGEPDPAREFWDMQESLLNAAWTDCQRDCDAEAELGGESAAPPDEVLDQFQEMMPNLPPEYFSAEWDDMKGELFFPMRTDEGDRYRIGYDVGMERYFWRHEPDKWNGEDDSTYAASLADAKKGLEGHLAEDKEAKRRAVYEE